MTCEGRRPRPKLEWPHISTAFGEDCIIDEWLTAKVVLTTIPPTISAMSVCTVFAKSVLRLYAVTSTCFAGFPFGNQAAGRPTGQILIHNAGWSGFSGRGGVQNLALPQDTAHVGKFSLRGVAFAFRAIKAIYLADGEFQVFSLPDSCLVCVQGREIQRSPPVSRSRFRHRSRHIRMQQNVSQTPIILCYFRETARGGGKEKKKVKQRIVTIFLHFGFI